MAKFSWFTVLSIDVRRGLGMKKYESVTDCFGDKFKEAEERTRTFKLNFYKCELYSANKLVRGMRILTIDKKLQVGMATV